MTEDNRRANIGLIQMLSSRLVRSGQFPAEMIRLLSQTQRMREDADYETALVVDEEAARDAQQRLLQFRGAGERFLQARTCFDSRVLGGAPAPGETPQEITEVG